MKTPCVDWSTKILFIFVFKSLLTNIIMKLGKKKKKKKKKKTKQKKKPRQSGRVLGLPKTKIEAQSRLLASLRRISAKSEFAKPLQIAVQYAPTSIGPWFWKIPCW